MRVLETPLWFVILYLAHDNNKIRPPLHLFKQHTLNFSIEPNMFPSPQEYEEVHLFWMQDDCECLQKHDLNLFIEIMFSPYYGKLSKFSNIIIKQYTVSIDFKKTEKDRMYQL